MCVCWGGGRRWGGEIGGLTGKKYVGIPNTQSYIKFQVPSSSGSLVLKQIKGITAITPPMFYGIQSKVYQAIFTFILNISLNSRILHVAQAILLILC